MEEPINVRGRVDKLGGIYVHVGNVGGRKNRRKDSWEEKGWGHVFPGRLRGNLFV
jgi:hypothetical protein